MVEFIEHTRTGRVCVVIFIAGVVVFLLAGSALTGENEWLVQWFMFSGLATTFLAGLAGGLAWAMRPSPDDPVTGRDTP